MLAIQILAPQKANTAAAQRQDTGKGDEKPTSPRRRLSSAPSATAA